MNETLGNAEAWRSVIETGQVKSDALLSTSAGAAAGLPFIIAAAGTGACRVAAQVNRLEVRYGWKPLPDLALLYTDTRVLPHVDARIPIHSFYNCSLDVDLFRAWRQRPDVFVEERGAVHGDGWLPVLDSAGARLVSAAANVAGYQARSAIEEELRRRKVHLLAGSSSEARDLTLVVPQFPGGTSTGLSPHLRTAGQRACASGAPRLHVITFLALPTELAEDGVRVNAQEAVIEAAVDRLEGRGDARQGQVICVSPVGPQLIIDSDGLADRAARIIWTLVSNQTGILPAYLADMANMEAASSTDLRGLHRSLSFVGVGAVDANLLEHVQRFTIELLIPVAEFLYGRAPIQRESQAQLGALPPALAVPDLSSSRHAATEAADAPSQHLPAPSAVTRPSGGGRRQGGPQRRLRTGEHARAEVRELLSLPLIGVEGRPYAALGLTQADERRLRGEYIRRVDEEYRRDVFVLAARRRDHIRIHYQKRIFDQFAVDGLPASVREGSSVIRAIDDELAATVRPHVRVTAEELERREKPYYKGRSLRQRLKRLQEHLDGRMRRIRYEALLWAFSGVRGEVEEQISAYEGRMIAAASITSKMRLALEALPDPVASSPDMHVVPAIQSAEALALVREEIAGVLAKLSPSELLVHVSTSNLNGLGSRLLQLAPGEVLGELAARLAEELSLRARTLSVGDFVLRAYEDGRQRLRVMGTEAFRRSLAVGSYIKERNGLAPKRIVYAAHAGSEEVARVMEEVLAAEGCLADVGERPQSECASAIHFLTVETGISPVCLAEAARGGSWYRSWFERQRQFEDGAADNPAARDAEVLRAVEGQRVLDRLDAAYVHENGPERPQRNRGGVPTVTEE